jgi:hypothetical protein
MSLRAQDEALIQHSNWNNKQKEYTVKDSIA